jgi:hypothetical protein
MTPHNYINAALGDYIKKLEEIITEKEKRINKLNQIISWLTDGNNKQTEIDFDIEEAEIDNEND